MITTWPPRAKTIQSTETRYSPWSIIGTIEWTRLRPSITLMDQTRHHMPLPKKTSLLTRIASLSAVPTHPLLFPLLL